MYYRMQYLSRPIKIGPYTTSRIEIGDLIRSWIVISLAFSILLRNNPTIIFPEGMVLSFIQIMGLSAITVGTAFLLHEIGHKIAAQRYGCFAEYRANNSMLIFALLLSFLGVIFFAPGAVMIAGPVGKRRNGMISAAGPGVNFGLAIIFLMLNFYIANSFWQVLFQFGYFINTWIGLFNMIPFLIFDGKKIYDWNKTIYFIILAIGITLLYSGDIIKGIAG